MAARLGTPPPSGAINAPPTPRLGFDDDWEPYAPRKSNRQRAQRAAKTPPPQSSSHDLRTSHSSPPTTVKKSSSTNMPGTTLSPPSTISKKRTSKMSPDNDTRRVSGALNEDSMASAAVALGLPQTTSERKKDAHRSATTQRSDGMLPTPAKTPRKRPTEAAPGITSIARNLFPVRPESVDEVMPSPKKGRKKYSGFTLDSFGAEDEGSSSIQIYTDSHERIPEVDMHPDNPFYGAAQPSPEPTKRASKRRKIMIPGEGEQTLEEASKRDDGLVYVFRGKKLFRKFSVDNGEPSQQHVGDSEAVLDADLDAAVPARLRGPLTRSSIKPRLLFPTAEQTAVREKKTQLTDDDEEAVTDIEEPLNDASTPTEQDDGFAVTPTAPRFAPFSPPPTARATRSGKKADDGGSSPLTPAFEDDLEAGPTRGRRGGKSSPFDSWRRSKGGMASQSKKREGETITKAGGEVSKKQRS